MLDNEKMAYNNGFILGMINSGIQINNGLSGDDTIDGYLINKGSAGTWILVCDGDYLVGHPQLSSCKYQVE